MRVSLEILVEWALQRCNPASLNVKLFCACLLANVGILSLHHSISSTQAFISPSSLTCLFSQNSLWWNSNSFPFFSCLRHLIPLTSTPSSTEIYPPTFQKSLLRQGTLTS